MVIILFMLFLNSYLQKHFWTIVIRKVLIRAHPSPTCFKELKLFQVGKLLKFLAEINSFTKWIKLWLYLIMWKSWCQRSEGSFWMKKFVDDWRQFQRREPHLIASNWWRKLSVKNGWKNHGKNEDRQTEKHR
jgi:hypothetical protein